MSQIVATNSLNNLQINYNWKRRLHRAAAPPHCAAANSRWLPAVLPTAARPFSLARRVFLMPLATAAFEHGTGCRTHCTDKINTPHIKMSKIKIIHVFSSFKMTLVISCVWGYLWHFYTLGFQLIPPNFLFWPQKQGCFYLDLLPSDQYHLCAFDRWAYTRMKPALKRFWYWTIDIAAGCIWTLGEHMGSIRQSFLLDGVQLIHNGDLQNRWSQAIWQGNCGQPAS